MFFDFVLYIPIRLMYSATSSGSAPARACGVGYCANSAGVTWFTDLSVVCADKATAMIRWNTF